MKISRGVSYRKAGDKIIIHNLNTMKNYQFTGEVIAIFDYVAKNPTHSVPTLLRAFDAKCDNFNNAQCDLGNLIDELLGEEIFTEIDDSATFA